mgnify:CR=1 FL=1
MIDVNMGAIGIKAFAAAVLGGFGSIPGALVGGIVVGIVEQLAGYYLPAGSMELTSNIVLLGVLIVWPQGLFGQTIRKRGCCYKQRGESSKQWMHHDPIQQKL